MLPISFVQNKDSPEPLYKQLSAYITALIRNGAFAETKQLPSIRALEEQISVSRNTIAAAYALLQAQGYISAKNRSGFHVTAPENIIFPQTERAPFVYKGTQDEHSDTIVDLSNGTQDGLVSAEKAAIADIRKLYRKMISSSDTDIYLNRGEPSGSALLRSALAQYLCKNRGLVCSSDQILIGSGTEYVLQIAVRILQARTGRESVYAVEDPGCASIRKIFDDSLSPPESEFSRIHNNKTTGIPIDDNGINIEKLTDSGADIVCVTPAHQYPSGAIMGLTRKADLLRWAYKTPNRYIIEDSYDSDLYYAATQPPALQGMDTQGRVLYFGTFSQIMAPSIQTAYLVLPPQLVHLFRRQFAYYSCTVPLMEQHVIAAFLQEGYAGKQLSRRRRLYKKRRDYCILQFKQKIPGIRISGAATGTHFLAEFPFITETERFATFLHKEGLTVKGVISRHGNSAFIIKYPFLTDTDCVFAADIVARVYSRIHSTIPLEE